MVASVTDSPRVGTRISAIEIVLSPLHVMPGLVPGIHVLASKQDVDGRDKTRP
jgi:hypothetical protein